MLQSEFISHLACKGVLRNPQGLDGLVTARRREVFGDLDWVGMTKLTQAAFADELAGFYRCKKGRNRPFLLRSNASATQRAATRPVATFILHLSNSPSRSRDAIAPGS